MYQSLGDFAYWFSLFFGRFCGTSVPYNISQIRWKISGFFLKKLKVSSKISWCIKRNWRRGKDYFLLSFKHLSCMQVSLLLRVSIHLSHGTPQKSNILLITGALECLGISPPATPSWGKSVRCPLGSSEAARHGGRRKDLGNPCHSQNFLCATEPSLHGSPRSASKSSSIWRRGGVGEGWVELHATAVCWGDLLLRLSGGFLSPLVPPLITTCRIWSRNKSCHPLLLSKGRFEAAPMLADSSFCSFLRHHWPIQKWNWSTVCGTLNWGWRWRDFSHDATKWGKPDLSFWVVCLNK